METTREERDNNRKFLELYVDESERDYETRLLNDADRLAAIVRYLRGLADNWEQVSADPLKCSPGVAEGISRCADELRAIPEVEKD